MRDDVTQLMNSIEAIKAAEFAVELPMSLEERSRHLALACRAAASLACDRRRAGLPDPNPEPWPDSTWEFLSTHAQRRAKNAG